MMTSHWWYVETDLVEPMKHTVQLHRETFKLSVQIHQNLKYILSLTVLHGDSESFQSNDDKDKSCKNASKNRKIIANATYPPEFFSHPPPKKRWKQISLGTWTKNFDPFKLPKTSEDFHGCTSSLATGAPLWSTPSSWLVFFRRRNVAGLSGWPFFWGIGMIPQEFHPTKWWGFVIEVSVFERWVE